MDQTQIDPHLQSMSVVQFRGSSILHGDEQREGIAAKWITALGEWGFPSSMAKQYADAFATQFISIDQGSTLSEVQLRELQVKVGHRQDIRAAAKIFRRAGTIPSTAFSLPGGPLELSISNSRTDAPTGLLRSTRSKSSPVAEHPPPGAVDPHLPTIVTSVTPALRRDGSSLNEHLLSAGAATAKVGEGGALTSNNNDEACGPSTDISGAFSHGTEPVQSGSVRTTIEDGADFGLGHVPSSGSSNPQQPAADLKQSVRTADDKSKLVPLSSSDLPGALVCTDRRNEIGITWRALSGGCERFSEFFAAASAIRSKSQFPKLFDRAFLDNKPMPFQEQDGSSAVFLFRIPDLDNEKGTTVATITNRLVVMFSVKHRLVLTYHRCDRDPLERMIGDWEGGVHATSSLFQVIDAINRCTLRTFRVGLRQLQERSDFLEDEKNLVEMVEGLTNVQKKAAVYRRCLSAGRQIVEELETVRGMEDFMVLLAETAESLESMLQELQENSMSSISMQVALDGFHSSRNTQVFTYISVVCQPITLATGWYGMNFVNMPELEMEYAYFIFAACAFALACLLCAWLVQRIGS